MMASFHLLKRTRIEKLHCRLKKRLWKSLFSVRSFFVTKRRNAPNKLFQLGLIAPVNDLAQSGFRFSHVRRLEQGRAATAAQELVQVAGQQFQAQQ